MARPVIACKTDGKQEQAVVQEFLQMLGPETTLPVAAIKVLIGVIARSNASTIMGMERELRQTADLLLDSVVLHAKSTIALSSGCELFLRYVTRCSLDFPDFEDCKKQVLHRGEKFAEMSVTSRVRIAELGHGFVRDGAVIMTHGYSRVVASLLLRAAQTKHFTIMIPEGRPEGAGFEAAAVFSKAGIPVSVILDSAVGYFMEQVDLCVVGAEGVVENGGVVNKVGTCQMAVVAKALHKPFYVAAESYKFARLYPLNQRDLPEGRTPMIRLDPVGGEPAPPGVDCTNPCVDYTPADYITLLFTDLGVLTPSAVSDELIRLYQ
eukprot:TRINITY_DN5094_c0_g3_i4.p1 TRINITY_DN5094_c0_g3~~TRINITY_DN5094_c0_g3_i4.p1  ORF type:complete len:341 (+),score=131.75 TRINITY_DN5094_c0_g3_i4:58-1023(+)